MIQRMFKMSISDTVPPAVSAQRKRFEALGVAVNKASSIRGWLVALFYTTLIFGLPSLALLADPLKDSVSITYHILIYGFRVLIIAMTILMVSRITTEMYTAKNDLNMKLQEIGYKDPKTNSKEETRFLYNNAIFSLLKIVILIGSAVGLFLMGSRDNYGYIIGHQIIYVFIIFSLILTAKFWIPKKPDYSPRLGGRFIILVFLPTIVIWGLETVFDFFSILTNPRFHYNILQISWGIIYPFVFLFLLIAVLITTKKTKREKMNLQEARLAEFKRKETFIQEKGRFSRARYGMQRLWNNFTQVFVRDKQKPKDLDKTPSLLLVRVIWITLFITFIPFAFMIPWNLFPQDGILIIMALMVSYQYSMIKYERDEIDVVSEPEKDEEIEPLAIRTTDLMNTTMRIILLPTVIFILAQYLMSSVVTSGDLSTQNEMITIGFTWISVLLVIPLSIQLIYHLNINTKDNRSNDNVKMFRKSIFFILGIELLLLVGTVVGKYLGQALGFNLFPPLAIILQVIFVTALIIIPLVYLYVIPNLTDEQFQITRIITYTLLALINVAILVLFVTNILSYFGILSFIL